MQNAKYESADLNRVRAFVATINEARPVMESKDIALALLAFCVALDLDYSEACIAVRDIWTA